MKLDARKLQLVMARKQLGVRELAGNAGMSAAAVSKYTRGLMQPSIKMLGKLSMGLGVDVTEIIQDETKKEQIR